MSGGRQQFCLSNRHSKLAATQNTVDVEAINWVSQGGRARLRPGIVRPRHRLSGHHFRRIPNTGLGLTLAGLPSWDKADEP
jgi:hypothetical protein